MRQQIITLAISDTTGDDGLIDEKDSIKQIFQDALDNDYDGVVIDSITIQDKTPDNSANEG